MQQEAIKDYTIGNFSFETFHEFRDAQEDLRKIDCINRELDIHDPEVAVRLYNDIRDGRLLFSSPIGREFFEHISDIVAEGSVDLLEDRAVANEAARKFKYQRLLGVAAIVLGVVFFSYVGITQIRDQARTKRLAALQETQRAASMEATRAELERAEARKKYGDIIDENMTESERLAEESAALAAKAADSATEEDPFLRTNIDRALLAVLPEYEILLGENPDLVGWLSIDGTNIDYPVVQQSDNNDYYLRRDFYGERDSAGTLFVDYRSDIVNSTTNTIIYGHNMKNGTMFGGLKNYLDESYFNEHKQLSFNTLYQHRDYEVIAVGLSEVSYQDESDYRYYNFIHAENINDWQDFVTNVSALTVCGDLSSLEPTDKILTLSTCNDFTEDGRLFLIAKLKK